MSKKEHNKSLIIERAKTLSGISVICPYCATSSNLLLIKKHNKTKKCIALKEKLLLIEPKAKYNFLEKLKDELIKYNKKQKRIIQDDEMNEPIKKLSLLEKQIKELSFIPPDESYYEKINREQELNNLLLRQYYENNNIEY